MIEGYKVAIAVMDFSFLAATMGSVVGERITRTIEYGTANRCAVIIVSASGGARMYEGMLSLMQMAKTSGALARHGCERLPYISVLTNPTTAGVMASFASLGDVILAEPKSMIGFAGPRVIKETTHQDLPEGFQTAEFLEEHGLIDQIVHRKKMRAQISQFLSYFSATQ
jgi:acetyl-CoA carboxylase carboxyl transferase subunit beta